MRVLAVTVLTSLDQKDFQELGHKVDLAELVRLRAKRAAEIGCDGVIASGQEAKSLRLELGDKPFIVTPGIRPKSYAVADDQKRTVGPREAFMNGADHIVVGRPILASQDPKRQAEEIQTTIAEVFAKKPTRI
jgi:orotidine-5'-phosphate decarboxylase